MKVLVVVEQVHHGLVSIPGKASKYLTNIMHPYQSTCMSQERYNIYTTISVKQFYYSIGSKGQGKVRMHGEPAPTKAQENCQGQMKSRLCVFCVALQLRAP